MMETRISLSSLVPYDITILNYENKLEFLNSYELKNLSQYNYGDDIHKDIKQQN